LIARLRGLLESTALDSAVIDVGGVGYLVSASARTLGSLGPAGSAVVLHIETQVREDAIQLFGFVAIEERDWFRLLLSCRASAAASRWQSCRC
jgi:Holliday junction DNA helicase RuvA